MPDCQHSYEIAYTQKHPGKVAECPTCDAKFRDGTLVTLVKHLQYGDVQMWPPLVGFSGTEEEERMRITPDGVEVPAGKKVRFTIEQVEEGKLIDNDKIVKAVATVKALSDEEYVLVTALCRREAAPKERKPRRKTKGLPEAQAEAPKA